MFTGKNSTFHKETFGEETETAEYEETTNKSMHFYAVNLSPKKATSKIFISYRYLWLEIISGMVEGWKFKNKQFWWIWNSRLNNSRQ